MGRQRKKYWEGIRLNERGTGYLVQVDDARYTLMQNGYRETKRGWVKDFSGKKHFHAYIENDNLIDIHIDKDIEGRHSAVIKPELVHEVRRIRRII